MWFWNWQYFWVEFLVVILPDSWVCQDLSNQILPAKFQQLLVIRQGLAFIQSVPVLLFVCLVNFWITYHF